MEDRYHYSLGQFFALNHGQTKLPSQLAAIFESYKMPPCCLKEPYMNPHNAAFNQQVDRSSRVIRAAAHAKHGDDRILTDIKNAFSCVTSGRDGTVLAAAKISQMIMPESKIDDIAQLFFDTMIQSPTMIASYIKVLFEVGRLDLLEDRIRLSFCKLVKATFQKPVQLPSTEIVEGETRTRQHRLTTCKIYANLYAYNYNTDVPSLRGPARMFGNELKLHSDLVGPLVSDVLNTSSTTREQSLVCLTECLTILAASNKFTTLKSEDGFQSKLRAIYDDKSFKMRLRLGLEEHLRGTSPP